MSGEPVTETSVEAEFEGLEVDTPQVGIVMGSKSDMPAMEAAAEELRKRGIGHEVRVMSAHREPDTVAGYAKNAQMRGLRVIIAGAGLSAALPGVVAAHTELPVIGVPLTSSKSVAGGLDALLSIAQMPPGVPVGCVGVDNARNAAVLAARILERVIARYTRPELGRDLDRRGPDDRLARRRGGSGGGPPRASRRRPRGDPRRHLHGRGGEGARGGHGP